MTIQIHSEMELHAPEGRGTVIRGEFTALNGKRYGYRVRRYQGIGRDSVEFHQLDDSMRGVSLGYHNYRDVLAYFDGREVEAKSLRLRMRKTK